MSLEPAKGQHIKVTRQQWIDAALSALETTPIDELKVLALAKTLDVSRSSFYWYFENQTALTDELLALWEHNTTSIVERASRGTATVVAACLGVFECWADRRLFHAGLDLAVREWARRDSAIRASVARADAARLEALAVMFRRHGFAPDDALVRARLLYHCQVGYDALGTDESIDARLAYLPHYLEAIAGSLPTNDELSAFVAVVQAAENPSPGA